MLTLWKIKNYQRLTEGSLCVNSTIKFDTHNTFMHMDLFKEKNLPWPEILWKVILCTKSAILKCTTAGNFFLVRFESSKSKVLNNRNHHVIISTYCIKFVPTFILFEVSAAIIIWNIHVYISLKNHWSNYSSAQVAAWNWMWTSQRIIFYCNKGFLFFRLGRFNSEPESF